LLWMKLVLYQIGRCTTDSRQQSHPFCRMLLVGDTLELSAATLAIPIGGDKSRLGGFQPMMYADGEPPVGWGESPPAPLLLGRELICENQRPPAQQ
jgi:hypothetical protein